MHPGGDFRPAIRTRRHEMALWGRWWPLTGLAFVGLWIGTLAVTDNDVDTHDSDAQIVAYYAKSGNQNRHIIAFLMVLAATLFFIWFLAKLRERLVPGLAG